MSQLHIVEDATYYYDPTEPERICQLIEGYIRDPETGLLVTLLQWEREAIHQAYGWRCRVDGSRRFTTIYVAIGRGNGKSGLLRFIAQYHLLPAWCGTAANEVIAVAANFSQLNATLFQPLKDSIAASPELAEVLEPRYRDVRVTGDPSKLHALTGKPSGKAGYRPSCVLVDELHEHPNGLLLEAMVTGMGKRMSSKPIMWIATNAGSRRSGIAWETHAKALRILGGEEVDPTFLPIVYAADEEDDPGDPETWAKANPSLGILCRRDHLESQWADAQGDPQKEATFRRYYLTQFVKDTSYALDEKAWHKCRGQLPDTIARLPCVAHLDASKTDDLTAVALTWYDEVLDQMYVRVKSWMPRPAAAKYIDTGIPYDKWKSVRIMETETLDRAAKLKIAKQILKLCKKYNILCLTYDPAYASEIVGYLSAKGIDCIANPQNSYNQSKGVYELMNRLKHRQIVLAPNKCLDWQAGNVEFAVDRHGNLYPKKPGEQLYKGGRKALKIDGIVALISSLSEWKRRNVGILSKEETKAAAVKSWSGQIRKLKL